MYYKILSGFLSVNCSYKVNGWDFVIEVRKKRGEEMSKSQFILIKYMYIPSMV